jgi:hypothetical protein
MTQEQSEMLDKLVRLANGDALLVEQAIRETSAGEDASKLEDIVQYIVGHRKDSVAA